MVLHVFNGGQSRTFGQELIGAQGVVGHIVDPWGGGLAVVFVRAMD